MSLAAWRAAQGTMRAIAPSMPPHACPLPGRRRPTPRFFAAGVVIDFAFTAVNGLEMALLAPGRATGGQRRIFVSPVQAASLRFKHASAVARPPQGYRPGT
jgi:hypothetical protein